VGQADVAPGRAGAVVARQGADRRERERDDHANVEGGRGSILLVEDEDLIRKMVTVALRAAGYGVTTATDGAEALERLQEALPDLIISDVMMPNMDGLDLLTRLRSDSATSAIPLILLTARNSVDDIVQGLGLGADDYLPKPFRMPELLARVQAKIERPSVPSHMLSQDRQTGLLREASFAAELGREMTRARRSGTAGAVAVLYLNELPAVRARLGGRAEAEIARQVAAIVQPAIGPLGQAGRDDDGNFLLLLPELGGALAKRLLQDVTQQLVAFPFRAVGERLRLSPTVGVATFADVAPEALLQRAHIAMDHAALHLDLQPSLYDPKMEAVAAARAVAAEAARQAQRWTRLRERSRLPFQILLSIVGGIILPFFIYYGLALYWYDITPVMYMIIVAALLFTAVLIWVEGFLALRRVDPPDEPGTPYPTATAIIAAYMPNEAATIIETVEAFLTVEYPSPIQIIVAYNTPRDLPVEAALQEIARRDPRLVPLRVQDSTSKAQNVNAALSITTGEFVGVFDADHHPQSDSFMRAWRWLSNGWDVVQGHCLIRNGDASWVAKMTAVEFEGIYTVAHPGRARLHGFGIFGGSNGYWKTDLLRQTRMHGFMLTEDIDSSLRVVEAGYRIQSDPWLISRELAPAELKALWNQRLRWAQGWFQVSKKHITLAMRSKHLSARQKFGMFHLLAWREIFPWLSLQMVPIIAFWALTRGWGYVEWFVPLFVFTSVFTLATGPGQAIYIRRTAHPEIRTRRGWILWYVAVAFFFYTEFKNLIGRLGHVKEFMGERAWKVTPRAGVKRT
jgi:CheY-like chemotaxis protein/cellulose synthase/poly-beta-1,6-N-acetylglucosamine synthase-like glycosyltransferase